MYDMRLYMCNLDFKTNNYCIPLLWFIMYSVGSARQYSSHDNSMHYVGFAPALKISGLDLWLLQDLGVANLTSRIGWIYLGPKENL